jgi:hypothetical protein
MADAMADPSGPMAFVGQESKEYAGRGRGDG